MAVTSRSRKHEFEKGFELKNSTSLFYLPISSSVKTWEIFRETSCVNFFRLSCHFEREKPVFWKASFWKTKTDYAHKLRVQDFANGKNFSFNQCSKQCFFFWGKLFYKSNRKRFFLCLHSLI